jgi:hypothetical protein
VNNHRDRRSWTWRAGSRSCSRSQPGCAGSLRAKARACACPGPWFLAPVGIPTGPSSAGLGGSTGDIKPISRATSIANQDGREIRDALLSLSNPGSAVRALLEARKRSGTSTSVPERTSLDNRLGDRSADGFARRSGSTVAWRERDGGRFRLPKTKHERRAGTSTFSSLVRCESAASRLQVARNARGCGSTTASPLAALLRGSRRAAVATVRPS